MFMTLPIERSIPFLLVWLALGACSSGPAVAPVDAATPGDGSTGATPRIVLSDGTPLHAVAGDVLRLSVALVNGDGARAPLPAGAAVQWSGPSTVTALPSGSSPTDSNLPEVGAAPTAFFLRNPEHYTDEELEGVLFVLDAGTTPGGSIEVHAHVVGAGLDTTLDATVPVGSAPLGVASRGAAYYSGNCAVCHGATGEGASAPALNDAPGNVVADPEWPAAIFASVTRGDIDNAGVAEGARMPNWLTVPTPSGVPLTTQEMVDVYAWLLTQGH